MDPIVVNTGADGVAVLHTVAGALASLGYTVSPSPDGWGGHAEVGSTAGRVLAGGFVRRMVLDYRVTQGPVPQTTQVVVTTEMSGWSGGALGASKAKKEWASVGQAIGQALQQSGLVLA